MAVVRIVAHDGSSRALQTFPLTAACLVIGRAPEAEISIDDPSLSRHHARVLWANGAWVLVEVASTNGIFVSGQRVASHTLRDGDRFKLGNVELEFREVDPRQAQTLAVDGQGAAQLMQQVQAERAARAPTPTPPPAPPSAAPRAAPPRERRGPGPAIAVALGLVVVGAGGAGAWWWLVGRHGAAAPKAPDEASADGGTKAPAAPADGAPRDGAVTTVVAKDETVEVQVNGGPKVTLRAGTFEAGTEITIRRVEDALAATVEGARKITPVWEFDAGGLQPRRDVTLELVLTDKPTLGPDERILAVRSEGGKLHGYPTDYDPTSGRVRTRIDHFTPIHLIAVGAVLIGGRIVYAKFGADEVPIGYDADYTSPEGFRIHYETSGSHAPAVETTKVGGHPRYVVRIGEQLDKALQTFKTDAAFSTFTKLDRDDLPNVFVKNTGATSTSGTFAETSGSGYSMVFHNALGARRIAATAPHELFHILQTEGIGFSDNANEKLWSEMSAEWAAFVVNPADAGPEIAATVAGNSGFVADGMNAQLGTNEQYAAGELAIFLEGKCPGLMKGLYGSSGSLNPWAAHDAWYTSTKTQMASSCPGVTLDAALDEYFARFFFVGGLATGRAPQCTNTQGLRNTDPYKTATSGSRAAASAQCDQVRSNSDVEPGPLVIAAAQPGAEGVRLWLTEQTRQGQAGEMPSGGVGVVGIDLLSRPDGVFVLEDFGGSATGARFHGVRLLVTNPTDKTGGTASYAAWVVHPPRGVASAYEEGPRRSEDKVDVKWEASKLPLASGTSGALASYKVLQKTAGGTRELAVVDAPTVSTKIPASAITWSQRRAEIVVRTVDRMKNESRDSLVVNVTQPADEPKPKPKKLVPPDLPPLPKGPCIITAQNPKCPN
jgi:hypothetical protein